MIKRLIREELRRGLGCRSRRSEREDFGSSPSLQEDSHSVRSSSRLCSSRHRSPASSGCTRTRSRPLVGTRPMPPTCQEVTLAHPPCSFVKPRKVPRRLFRAGPFPRPPRHSLHLSCSSRLHTRLIACLRLPLHHVLCSRCFRR